MEESCSPFFRKSSPPGSAVDWQTEGLLRNTNENGIHLEAFFAPAKNQAFRGSGLRLHSGPCPTDRNAPRPSNPLPVSAADDSVF
ncbi:MAG TPA: hypothetical protein DEO40_05410 [Treponema sp.]|nr:hypothetical protein [Treponema sp.]